MPLVACERCVVLSVVSLVSRERSEAASVVSPVSCVGGEVVAWGSLLVISFVRVKPVAPLLGCFGDVVKPEAPLSVVILGVVKLVAPLLLETGCFSGETARRWCHRFRLRAVGVVTVVLPVSIEGQMVVTVVPLVACERSEAASVVSLVSIEGQMVVTVVPLVACERCVVLSVVSPVSCEHS